eukprot:CAMPEP_0198212840 /NCGR_PEP_ID=MMETSP1445-20131203/27895_1 /TAXON_ID=36898 /ORGANISM="Pyramimonas sp., Strain CCMP2087" /LENGTH=234 /DNA_ID=CAMNT_0043887389 /DNA_START=78 /DNA_END=782 /DNA_ORIENTATION=+
MSFTCVTSLMGCSLQVHTSPTHGKTTAQSKHTGLRNSALRLPARVSAPRVTLRSSTTRTLQITSEYTVGDVYKTGETEKSEDGSYTDNYTIFLGGNSPANVPLQFRKGSADVVFRIPRPLGIAFEEKMVEGEACCVAEEVIAGSNAEKAGVQAGDILRLTTAVFTMKGVVDVTSWLNPPKNNNILAYFVADGKPFKQVMDALVSNGQMIDTPRGKREVEDVSLLLERPGGSASA